MHVLVPTATFDQEGTLWDDPRVDGVDLSDSGETFPPEAAIGETRSPRSPTGTWQ